MADNPYLKASSVEELRKMERDLYDECFSPDGKEFEGADEYYETQMALFEEAFATLFPDDYDYHKRGKQNN